MLIVLKDSPLDGHLTTHWINSIDGSNAYPCFADTESVEAALDDISTGEIEYGPIYSWCFEEISLDSVLLYQTSFSEDIGGWNVSLVTSMNQMFKGAESFNQDIRGWDVGKVTNMYQMF